MINGEQLQIGIRVVRSIGDYVVGRTGAVVDTDIIKSRARVQWDGESKTWVSFKAIELESTPYEIVRYSEKDRNPKTNRIPNPRYVRV